ncbi:MAG: hypothetical protein ABSF15_15220 [Candidatus Sulfotelmatobacter sp.]
MPNAVAVQRTHILEWLAIPLTQALGPTRARKLVEHFGSAEAVFRASLTELGSTGMQAVSAQSIATGKSAELAREEMARAAAAGVTVASGEDACYPPWLKEIYDRRWFSACAVTLNCSGRPASPRWALAIHTPYGSGMAKHLAGDLGAPGISILRQSRRYYDCGPLKGA